MKKENSGKKSLLWLWITIGVVAALVVAGVLCVALGVFESSEKKEKFTSKIYWNMDGQSYMDPATGLSDREASDDGMTYIRFAVGGEVKELPVADRTLVHKIDMKVQMCLKFDDNGVIIDMVDVEEVYTKIADKVFVTNITGDTIMTNSSQALNGMPLAITLNENTGIYNMTDKTEKPGYPGAIEMMDQILVYGTDENTPTDIFITHRYWYSDVYWRVSAQMYNSSAKMSTREKAEDGYWYVDWTVNGETVTLRTNKQDVINAWDGYSVNAACCGMVFDENGDVIDCFNAALAARGAVSANGYDVTALAEDGSSFTATRLMFGTEIGKTYTSVIDENTKIFNVNSTADVFGEVDELQMNDRVYVIADTMGKAKIIFITNRMVDSPMYYNVSRNWSSGLQKSQRTPDADGWYHIKLAVKGKEVTYRTKDVKIVDKLDSYNLSLFGLRFENGIITKVYDAVCVTGNYSFAANNFVDSIDGSLLATSNTAGTAANGVLAENCEVYDVSGHGKFKGVATTVRVGDRVICYQNTVGEITHVYILNRHEEGTTLYWNVNRYYSGGKSTRDTQKFDGQPLKDDKYYYFRVIKVGQTKVSWVKVSVDDVDIVNRMDSYGTPTAFSLRVNSSGVVTAAYPCNAASGGYQAANYLHIDKTIEDENGIKYGIKSYRTGATGTITLADDVAVYDYTADSVLDGSPIPEGGTIKGSRTTLRVGDKVSCIAGRDGKIHTIFIIERETSGAKLALRKSGTAKAAEDGYYYFELIIDGKVVKVKTDDEATAKKVAGYGYAFAVKLSGDKIVGVYTATASSEVYEQAGGAYYDVVKIEGGKIYLKRNRVGQSDTGKETTLELASNYVAYNIDPTTSEYGKQVKLKKGDRVFGYTNYDAKLAYIYIAYECTREGGNMGYCAHCGKTVHWESVAAGYAPAKGYVPEVAHYYVPNSYETASGMTFGHANQLDEDNNVETKTEFVLDLNGKTWTRKGTVNEEDGKAYASGGLVNVTNQNTLIITDYSKAGTGAMVSQNGIVYKSGYTGLAHSQKGATMIIEKGLFDASGAICTNQVANGGAISVGGTLIVNGGTIKGFKENTNANWGGCAIGSWGDTSITINGGTIIGGKATNMGGTISANSDLTINGGKIYGGTAAVGDNIRFGNGNLVITGGEIDGGIHISSAKSITLSGKPVVKAGTNYGLKPGKIKMDVSGLKAGASIYVDASGVFTKDLASAADAQALITNGALKAGAEGMMLKVEGKAVTSVADGKIREWTDATKLPDMGRWKLTVDVTVSTRADISSDLYIDLNGHDITRTVKADATTGCQVFRVTTGKLTIADSTSNPGTVSTAYAEGQAINDYSAVIHVTDQGEMVLEGGIIDGSNVDNLYTSATNGTISVGGKLTVNGGEIKGVKRGSSNGGAIGAWAGTEITINGGKIYAGGSFLNEKNNQKVNGAAIATTGKLTINGGEIIGPGATKDAEKRSRSGGLIYANGDSMIINGGKFYDGFGTGYGFNIYYERNYLGVAGADGKRPTVSGGGEVVIGGDAYINGGVTIRSSKADVPVKLTVKDNAVIDSTGAVSATNVRLYNGELYLNSDTTAITTAPENENYDISLVYTCKNAPKGFSVGNTTKYEHSYGDDHLCDDCGYDKNTPVAWTDATKLPTSGNYYLDVNVETSATTAMAGELYLDLNGHTITHKALVSAIQTGANKLTITDSSTEKTGKITTSTLNGEAKGLIYIQANGELLLEAGTIDGSNVTNTYTGANAGTITIGNGKIGGVSAYGSATINGGKVIGWKSSGNGSAIGMMNLTSLTINGGEIIGNQVTKSINGTGYGGAIVANGHLTITGGKISGGTATVGGDNIFVNNASAKVTISGGEIDGGIVLNNFSADSKISGTVTIKEGANYGLKFASGKTIDMTGLTGGEIYIDADGKFTTDFIDAAAAEAAKAFLKSGDAAKKLALDGIAIKTVSLVSVSLSKTELELTEGTDETITATADPADATVTWTSSDDTIATVVDGKITAVKAGTVTITATAEKDGASATATCAVTVKAAVVNTPIEEQAWVDWTDATKLPTAGKYKLMTNVTFSATQSLTGELWLDLNGQTVTMTGNAQAINTAGQKLVIDDLSGKTGDELGTIKTTATSINASAAVIYVNAIANGTRGELVLNNGIIDGSSATNTKTNVTNGTVVVGNATNAFSTFTMNGGVIKGQKGDPNTSGTGGSCVGLYNSTSFVMNGGKLIARTSTSDTDYVATTGSCISAGGVSGSNPASSITINGGELIGSRTRNHGGVIATAGNLTINGGTLYGAKTQNSSVIWSNGPSVTINGGVLIGGTTVANPGNGAIDKQGGTITVGGNAVIGGGINVRGSAKLVFTGTPVVDSKLGAEQKFDVRINGGSVHLDSASNTAISNTNGNYKVTYGADGKVNGLAAYAAVAQTESTTIPTTGNVKLTADVTLTETLVTTGALRIDLNGHTVTYTGNAYAINAKHNLIIDDTATGENKGTIKTTTANVNGDASVIYVTDSAKLIIVDGIIDGTTINAFATDYAGAVTLYNKSAMYMLGGEIKGQRSASAGSTGKGGGCVAGRAGSLVVIYDGKLTAYSKDLVYSSALGAAQGSCISTAGTTYIHGGTLQASIVGNHGGAIYSTGDVYITDGLITGGTSTHSGNISCSGNILSITGGTIIDGTAKSGSALGGHNIDKLNGTLIIGGDAVIAGGVSTRGSAKVVLSGNAVIDKTLQTAQKYNLRLNSTGGIFLNEATGTALTTTKANYKLTHNAVGLITGVEAE